MNFYMRPAPACSSDFRFAWLLLVIISLLRLNAGTLAFSEEQPVRAEKLILGFEWDECKAKRGKAWFECAKRDAGHECWAPFEYQVGDRVWTWTCQPGQVTEGRCALVSSMGPPATTKDLAHVRTEFL